MPAEIKMKRQREIKHVERYKEVCDKDRERERQKDRERYTELTCYKDERERQKYPFTEKDRDRDIEMQQCRETDTEKQRCPEAMGLRVRETKGKSRETEKDRINKHRAIKIQGDNTTDVYRDRDTQGNREAHNESD
jgi:hypothetical protein